MSQAKGDLSSGALSQDSVFACCKGGHALFSHLKLCLPQVASRRDFAF